MSWLPKEVNDVGEGRVAKKLKTLLESVARRSEKIGGLKRREPISFRSYLTAFRISR